MANTPDKFNFNNLKNDFDTSYFNSEIQNYIKQLEMNQFLKMVF